MNTLHLFAGAGGGIIADMILGHTPVGAVEIDPFCRKVLQMRQDEGWLPKFPIFEDVRSFSGDELQTRVDCVSGGFPCQDISCAGKGAGITGARSGLFYELARICRNVRPCYIFLENSPFIVSRGLDAVLCELAEMGYDAEWCVLSAADLGAWHRRERWWCLCQRQDYISNGKYKRSAGGAHAGKTLRKMVEQGTITEEEAQAFGGGKEFCPTPMAWDRRAIITPSAYLKRDSINLAVYAICYPTREHALKKENCAPKTLPGNIGQLSPDWVEWLMGWPIGWTALKPLETVKCQQ